jgi:cell wall assembly regulator SMI1
MGFGIRIVNGILRQMKNLTELENILDLHNKLLVEFLNPPLIQSALSEKDESIFLRLPPDVQELYKWHNGTKWTNAHLGSRWIFPLGIFLGFSDAIDAYKQLSGTDEYWKDYLFPLFASGAGEFFLINIDTSHKNYGKIFFYCLDTTSFEVIISFFDSLNSCIATITSCYKTHTYWLKKENSYSYLEFKSVSTVGDC